MRYKVVISNQGQEDIRQIYTYIAFELLNPDAAENLLIRLEDCIASLSAYPERFRLYEREPWKSRGFRMVAVNRYVVFYYVREEEKTVFITRVFYSGMNYSDPS